MILINNVFLPLDADFNDLIPVAAKSLKINPSRVLWVKLFKKSVDARHKNDIKFCVSLICKLSSDEAKAVKGNKSASVYEEPVYEWKRCKTAPARRPVVVGFGPAGMFCALALSRAGLKPIILERGFDVDTRTKDVNAFFSGERLKENSNIQFGEGGAGTFSDGKLNTGIKDKRIREVLKTFVYFGAKSDILTESKPHIGTDYLKETVKNIRNEIISLGGEIRFGTLLDGLKLENGRVTSVFANGREIKTDTVVLAIGHSARDTYEMLKDSGFKMEKKPFAIGIRIEHLQKDINKALYGEFAGHKSLGPADYKLAVHLKNGRGVFTFCMCPGGEVVNASSEDGGIAVNGMSENARNKENANSAVLVGVNPEDFGKDDVLAGVRLQREIERKAFSAGAGAVPVTTAGGFLFGKEPKIGRVKPSVKPKTVFADLGDIFPEFIVESLKEGILAFDKKISGFADGDSIITAPETRSSSPVRILRGEDGQALNIKGVYPCGEGAGYAGGITSSAVDGMKTAENIIEALNN
ncbi:MAG TPA: hypothetical protein DEW35_01005 [Ruminococcaceae bacterium]|nr:hypothetical protein [Oscillospiraceae bacterium]